MSRPLLESYVRARVGALAGVEILGCRDVIGLTSLPAHRSVSGVRVLAGPMVAPRRSCLPIWSSMPPAVVPVARCGSKNSVTSGRPGTARYEALRAFPEGYLVVGDAISCFNPVYGQGMTIAAGEALLLRDCLPRGPADLAPRFFRRAARLIDVPWSMAVGNDLRFPEVAGHRSLQSPRSA